MNGFMNGLSDAFRLRVTSRGGVDYWWSLEIREAGGWIGGSTVGLVRHPFWKKKITRYLQNNYFIVTDHQEAPHYERCDSVN